LVFFVYILSSRPHGTLYVGNTDNLMRRIWEHKSHSVAGFTAKYRVDQLVWFEAHETRASAWAREKQKKEWKRAWKIELIERENPHWADLYGGLAG
jgi:putative endonuclease